MAQDNDDHEWRWWPDQYELLEGRYGRQFLRVVAATFYPEVSNNCAWILRKT